MAFFLPERANSTPSNPLAAFEGHFAVGKERRNENEEIGKGRGGRNRRKSSPLKYISGYNLGGKRVSSYNR